MKLMAAIGEENIVWFRRKLQRVSHVVYSPWDLSRRIYTILRLIDGDPIIKERVLDILEEKKREDLKQLASVIFDGR